MATIEGKDKTPDAPIERVEHTTGVSGAASRTVGPDAPAVEESEEAPEERERGN